jgi:hypothetical protein
LKRIRNALGGHVSKQVIRRKRGGRNDAQLKIIDIAGQVLQEIDAKEKWKALLNCVDPLIALRDE